MGLASSFCWWLVQFIYKEAVNEGVSLFDKILSFGLTNFEATSSGLVVTSFSGNGTSTSRTFSKNIPPDMIQMILRGIVTLYKEAIKFLKKEGIEEPIDEEIVNWILDHVDDVFFQIEVTDYRYVLP